MKTTSTPRLRARLAGALLLLVGLLASPQLPAQVSLVKDIRTGVSDSNPRYTTMLGGTVYFRANDGTTGYELWKTDGTEAGTVLFKDIRPGSGSSFPAELTVVGSTLYFQADDGINGTELWKSDGTAAGTVLVKDLNPGSEDSAPGYLTVVGSTLYFTAVGPNGRELYKSDGTEAGTVLVKDINPGSEGADPGELKLIGSTLYFAADDGTNGIELWKSDGTEAGTVLVKDIQEGTGDSGPTSLVAIGNTLYFTADDDETGQELYKSDGTGAGTVLVTEINPGSGDSFEGFPSDLTVFGGTLYFAADDGTNGLELWKSDGTAAGTVLVKDIRPGTDESDPRWLTVVGNTLYFAADDGINGTELWKSDGTEAGTVLVKDIRPGPDASSPDFPVVVGGTLYFRARDGITGRELWKSDGTAAGTVLVKDIYPGSDGSTIDYLTVVGSTLYFQANDGTNGLELWKLDEPCDARVAGLPTTPGRTCRGEILAVTFATVGACPSPPAGAFTVQLSNATGSFANPTVLGEAQPGTTPLALPSGLPLGTGYRVRIVSSLPAQTSAASLPFQVAGPSLAVTPTVSGGPACRGSDITIGFSLPVGGCAFPEGNQFTAQLSSAFGSFNNPTDLGIVTPGQSTVTIPAGVSAGSGYRIRLVSSNPALTSASSAAFQVKACASRLSAEEPGLVVGPNPALGGEIRVRVSGMDSPAFSLTTAAGRSLSLSAKTDGGGAFVLTPKQRLAAGVYVLQASEGTTRLTARVLVAE